MAEAVMEVDLAKLAAVESRLREVIHVIVKRRVSHGVPLSWRLMFDIEDEAMSIVGSDPELDADYLCMMAAPSAPPARRTDEPVGLGDMHVMHTALWMIQEAYYRLH
jgi:hypothetical protein